jgi:hypothetical protein
VRTSLINLALIVETALVVWTGYVFYKWSLANAGSEPFTGLLPYRGSFALVLAPWLIGSLIIPACLIVLAVAESKSISKRMTLVPMLLMVLVPMLLILVALIAVGYWHVYGRPRVLLNHGVQGTDKPVLEGGFQLVPEGIGSALSGIIVSQKEGWIINRVTVDVRIRETRHCGENSFPDTEWDEHCAENPNYSKEANVDRETYECFVGALAYLQQGNCNARTILAFDPTTQHFDVSVSLVIGHPKDPFGVLR